MRKRPQTPAQPSSQGPALSAGPTPPTRPPRGAGTSGHSGHSGHARPRASSCFSFGVIFPKASIGPTSRVSLWQAVSGMWWPWPSGSVAPWRRRHGSWGLSTAAEAQDAGGVTLEGPCFQPRLPELRRCAAGVRDTLLMELESPSTLQTCRSSRP